MRSAGCRRAPAPFIVALLLLFAVACNRAPASEHEALTAGAEPLRAEFNRDADHTRIVVLAAPT